MSAHADTEDPHVEQPGIGLFAEFGWATVSAVERLSARCTGRPALPPEAITAAGDELTRDCSALSRFSGQMNLKTN